MIQFERYRLIPEFGRFTEFVDTADIFTKGIAGYCNGKQRLERGERATLQISSGAFSIVFSLRELLAAGYLVPAKCLLRPLIDRISTIAYLRSKGDAALDKWERGWLYGERPSNLKEKIVEMVPFAMFEDTTEVLSVILQRVYKTMLDGEIHGDLQSSLRNSVLGSDGDEYLASGPNLHNPSECAAICKLALALTMQLVKEVQTAIPQLRMSKAA